MIHYFGIVNETMNAYLHSWGRRLKPWVTTYPYAYLDAPRRFEPGTYVFADIERLSSGDAARYAACADDLRARGTEYCVLNHPTRSMRRHELLRTLREEGVNDFAAWRTGAEDAPSSDVIRFPVFVRGENDHDGPLTDVLRSADEYEAALGELRTRRGSLEGLLTTEFRDASGPDGVLRKYSAFCIAGQVVPRHVFFSRAWVQKAADLCDADRVDEEFAYVQENPDARRIAAVFARARIDYGRIDYARRIADDGSVQIRVWEINTNPNLVSAALATYEARNEVHATAAAGIADALLATLPGTALRPGPWRRVRSWWELQRGLPSEA